jgi:hypothetical protein
LLGSASPHIVRGVSEPSSRITGNARETHRRPRAGTSVRQSGPGSTISTQRWATGGRCSRSPRRCPNRRTC